MSIERFDQTPGKPGNRTRRYRWLVSPSHHLTWLLGQKFPDAVPLVFVTGFPKSGTTWFSRMLSHSLGLPLPLMSIFPIGFPSVMRGHLKVKSDRALGYYVLRDGRDALVSLYFHLARSLPDGDNPMMSRRQRRLFPGLVNKVNVSDNLPAFLERQFKKPMFSAGQMHWGNHVRWYFNGGNPGLKLIRYEQLLSDCEQTLVEAVRHFNSETSEVARLAQTVDRFSFASESLVFPSRNQW